MAIRDSNASDAQKWRIDDNGDGTYTFVSKMSGTVLDIAGAADTCGANVQIYAGSNGTAAQKFSLGVFVEGGSRVVSDGEYEIASALGGDLVLDVDSASMEDCANVQLWTSNGTLAQRWRLAPHLRRIRLLCEIVCVQSGKALDVANAGTADGTNVWQYAPNGSDAQKWRLDVNADGTFTPVSKLSGTALDVNGADDRNGSNVQIYSANGTSAQKWRVSYIGA